ncbi:hypothetical protein P885DRAFT_73117 [Corynascus similis CBS 632.67]
MVPSKQDKVITTTQLGEHKTVHDLWIAVHGYVCRHPSPRAGPKLTSFTSGGRAQTEFVEFLSRENDVDSLICKVIINGTGHFALKVVSGDLTSPLAYPQLYVDCFDPFSCECRAYGRLKDVKREDLAVKAHGYLLLMSQQEADLEYKVTRNSDPVPDANAGEFTSHNFWSVYKKHRGLPVRAIVKKLVSSNCPTSAEEWCMWPDLQDLHSLGILLIVFSRSLAMYHPSRHCIFKRTLRGLVAVPQDLEAFCSGDLDRYQNLPITDGWLRWEEDPDAAVAFVEQALSKEEAQ